MGKLGEPRISLVVESYLPASTAGRHGKVHVRPVAGQGFGTDIQVRCNRKIVRNHRVGTRFRIWAMLTDHLDGTQYLSSHHDWDYVVIGEAPISN